MTESRALLGQEGERLAEQTLRRAGLKRLERRFRTPVGEIDLVMRDGETIVLVEVKTRRDRGFADPEASVDAAKQRKLRRCAEWLLHRRGWEDRPVRFDVVAVVLPENGPAEIKHIPDAFRPR